MKLVRFIQNRWLHLALFLAIVGMGCAGCASDDVQNTSARPWNSPEGWQYGNLPTTFGNGH